ncbi:MAG: DUF420 domain-containing protein [Verrucomicrobiota bacterium]
MTVSDLPTLNASLNAVATVLLIGGWLSIRAERKKTHIAFMVSALVVSAAFLTSYLVYHYYVGSVKFAHGGMLKVIYYIILFPHIVLAAVNVPMIILTVIPALRQRFDRHKRIARWTLPVWLYVSVTGVLVYLMLYVWFPGPKG